ncbi:MAG: DNA replication/repair protein RecF [Anaerolineales bacterium]|uniref:DNA replication and repair protein RecF n=1 Tax=Candidatus Desulfolinea nitratireducens TaxID=2841698 RepID=A0A8J6NP34_9CHLR|nr:DNA replication/repair protein RecF [Candidatus Desulfolinea nitratireducens]MBL6961564.1 DNA replication/repair protein RecF [Anaerolineales bacterium]
MHLTHLSLTNFRNFARLDMDIPRGSVLLVGSNAQGKTSILEAIYFLAAFTSFQTNSDRQLINFISARSKELTVGRIVADYKSGGASHRLEVRLIYEPVGVNGKRLRKEILLDGVKRSANEAVGHFNAVLFVPQMSQIIEGGPDERRRYLNQTLAQIIPAYAHTLSEYAQAVSQRNALLKQLSERGGDPDQLAFWDETVTDRGARLILWRIQAIQELETLAARIHRELTHGSEVLRLAYQPAFDPLATPQKQFALKMETETDRSGFELDPIKQAFAERLIALRSEEIARGVTTIGPHRDELRFMASGTDLGHYGSRGQIRTALLSLKLAEVDWMKNRSGEWPVILLDEVMAELDSQRRQDLLQYLGKSEQALLTTTDSQFFTEEFIQRASVWEVQKGTVRNS